MITDRRIRVGLKLWSPNVALAAKAAELHASGWIDLIELYVVPGTFDETIAAWRDLGVPFMLHCPHSKHKFNLAKVELEEANAEKYREVRQFAEALSANVIVMHGGNRGEVSETIRQLIQLDDPRIHLENKPKVSLSGGLCIGYSPEQVAQIVSEARLPGIVLDFGHATCAANSVGVDPFTMIDGFLELGPRIFHIGDGDRLSEKDNHFNFGEGSFDIARMLSLVPADSTLTLETPTDLDRGLLDFVENVSYLRAMLDGADERTSR